MFSRAVSYLKNLPAVLTPPARQVDQRVSKLLKEYEKNAVVAIPSEIRLTTLLNLQNLDCQKLHQLLLNEWDNVELHNFVEDIFDVLLSYGELSKTPNSTYRHYIHVNKVLGAGAQGVVSAGLFGVCDESIFAIKNVTSLKASRDLLREFVVGRELTKLGNPVFTRIYSIFPCSQVLSVDKKPLTFCQTSEQYSIGFQVLQGKPLKDAELTTAEFEIIFMIILSALYQAAGIEFTHNDLHNENVFVRKLDEPVIVPIHLPGISAKYVLTEYFPFILDYGLGRIKSSVGDIMPDGYEEHGIKNEYTPMHDIFKFLFFTLEGAPNLGIEHLMNIFEPGMTPSNSKMFVRAQKVSNTYFVVPEGLRSITLREYIRENAKHFEKHAYKRNPADSYRVVGTYESENFFEEFGLLQATISTDDFTDSVLENYGIPLENNSMIIPEITEEKYLSMLEGISSDLRRIEDKINLMDVKVFQSYYYNLTDRFRTAYDGINRYFAYNPDPSSKRKLKSLFNHIGDRLKPLDRYIRQLIKEGYVPEVTFAIFRERNV